MPRNGIVGSHGKYIFNYRKLPNCSPKWLCHFTFPPPMYGSSSFLFPFQHLVMSVLSDFSHSSRYVAVSHCVLISISLITNDVEHLLM